jgi:signal transduction histidine kinase
MMGEQGSIFLWVASLGDWMLQDPTFDLLKFSSFPAVGAALRARADEIVRRWDQVARQKLPRADELTRDQLRDHLPGILQEMAQTLEASDGGHVHDLRQASEGHGELRFHQSFNVNELLIEYGLLRPILVDEVISHLRREIGPEEIAALNMGVDLVVRRSVTQFISHHEKQIKTLADAQSKYLSFLSHDLRGGLNGVLLMAEVLKRALADEPRFAESIEDLDSMRRSILDTVATMDRFLQAEGLRQGKVQPRNTTVDINSLLKDVSHHFAYQAKEKGIELQVHAMPDARVFSDKDLLSLILQNLISNAIKYTPKGEVRVEADAIEGHMTISVIDEGPGIDGDKLESIFEPFKRGETHGQAGVGLGLSIAKQAAELLGVTLTAQTNPGHGSTFKLVFNHG